MPVAGRGDRAVPPGFAGVAGWRPAAVAVALSFGSARRSIGAPGHNDDRSRTPRHSRPPGKTVDAGALRRSPSPPFRREGTTATRLGRCDLIYRGCWAVFSGRFKKNRSSANGRGFPSPPSALRYQSLGQASAMMTAQSPTRGAHSKKTWFPVHVYTWSIFFTSTRSPTSERRRLTRLQIAVFFADGMHIGNPLKSGLRLSRHF